MHVNKLNAVSGRNCLSRQHLLHTTSISRRCVKQLPILPNLSSPLSDIKATWLRCKSVSSSKGRNDDRRIETGSGSDVEDNKSSGNKWNLFAFLADLRLVSHAAQFVERIKAKFQTVDPWLFKLVKACLYASLAWAMLFTSISWVLKSRKIDVPQATVPYSAFVQCLDSGLVKDVKLESGWSCLQFTTTSVASTANPSEPASKGRYSVRLTGQQDTFLTQKILAAGAEFTVVKPTFFTQLSNTILTLFAVWIPLTPLIFLVSRAIESRTGSKSKKSRQSVAPSTTFADVAGVDTAKAELMEVVMCLKKTGVAYQNLNVKMPSGVLLYGPPGTGKTLLAKAVAGEAGVPFIALSASEFVELFVGRGAARVRELFSEARKSAPCVVFIDELDAMGGRRGMGFNDERDQTLNQLLTELDGFEGRPGVLFLGATNRMNTLDPALLRPGRISRKVQVPLPDEAGRAEIMAVHLRSIPLEETIDRDVACASIAKATYGFSGAELANVANEAALLAARAGKSRVGFRDLVEGTRRTRFGANAPNAGGPMAKFADWLTDIAASSAASSAKPVKSAML